MAKKELKPEIEKTEPVKPEAVKSKTAKPKADKPEAVKTDTAKSKADKPETVKPKEAKSKADKPETVKTKTAKPKAEKSETVKPKEAKPKADKPEAVKPKEAKPKADKPEAVKPKEAKPKAEKSEAVKPKEAKPKTAKVKTAGAAEESGRVRAWFGAAVAAVKRNKIRTIIIAAISLVCITALILGIVLGTRSCSRDNPIDGIGYKGINKYATTTQVGYYSEVVDTVKRNRPVSEVKNEGMAEAYPAYGYTLSSVIGTDEDKVAARNAIIGESSYLTATGTANAGGGGYTWMDENGYLYSGTRADEPLNPALDASGNHRQLYKHTAAESMYYQGLKDKNGKEVVPVLSDDEPGIIKKVTLRPRGYNSYSVTGVYAPAGEVIKIQLSEADMEASGGIVIHIGQALYNGQSNNIWTAKNQMQRFPNILNTMVVNKNTAVLENGVYTAYVGSFIGGPLYVRNTKATVTVTISGGVRYSHFILGYTTPEEFEENKKSTAPYFDLEVWNFGVLHSGPKYRAQSFSYDDLYKAGVLWEKVSSVTTTGSSQGVVFLYDPFVAAGAAVAFPGRSSVNCPDSWMAGSLNYDSLVSSGSWGNFHEYHHNFQGYGVGNGGEVTNNGMTLVSYALFTKISAKRGIESYGAQGLGGWNNYTSAPWALNEVLKIKDPNASPSNGDMGLSLYATLLHNFGADNYIKAKVNQRGGQNYQAYANAWETVTHNNMSYYFNELLGGGITSTAPSEYPMFVPVSSVYQTGRSYMYDGEKKYFNTMQPYVIPYGYDFSIDLGKYTATADGHYQSGSVMIPDGFEYKIKSFTQPSNGKVSKVDSTHLKYTPDKNKPNEMRSGEFKVTLSITGKFKVDDVDLVLAFEQSHETKKAVLEHTVYSYDADKMYNDAAEAYEAGFAGYKSVKEKADHANPTQNCNTDIWLVAPGFETLFPDAPEDQKMANNYNTVHVIEGKLYFQDEGKYRIFLRGRKNCAVYYWIENKNEPENYQLGAKFNNGNTAGFYINNEESYFDVEMGEKSWLHFKEVLLVREGDASFIGLGYGAWVRPQYRSVEKYYDVNGKEVDSPDAEGYHHSVTTYYDNNNKQVPEEIVNSAKDTPPQSVSYANAYRSTYQFPDNKSFESEYFYIREYKYNYTDNKLLGNSDKKVIEEQCANLNLSYNSANEQASWGGNDVQVVLDGITDRGNWKQLHTVNGVNYEKNPFTLAVDLGEVCKANRLSIYTHPRGDIRTVRNLNLYASVDGENWNLVKQYTDIPAAAVQTLDFDDTVLRYYKIEVTACYNGNVIIRELQMWHTFEVNGGKMMSPDDRTFIYKGEWKIEQACSTFGHVYAGKAGDEVSFDFTGTRVSLLSSAAFGNEFEVIIDGNTVNSIELKDDNQPYSVSYMSELLENKQHTVVIKCKGNASIDSIVLYP